MPLSSCAESSRTTISSISRSISENGEKPDARERGKSSPAVSLQTFSREERYNAPTARERVWFLDYLRGGYNDVCG
ncbi:MAG: hypothetical protein FD153_1789 [Rhodospirillaceae bacterium]|nr:MAG: hypothetical protein FD153_1789 [Rhodospirillaceae bacterium]